MVYVIFIRKKEDTVKPIFFGYPSIRPWIKDI